MTIITAPSDNEQPNAPVSQKIGRIIRGKIATPLSPSVLVLTREQAERVSNTMRLAMSEGFGAELWFTAGGRKYHIAQTKTSHAIVVERSTDGILFYERHASLEAFATAYCLQTDEPKTAAQAAAGGMTQTAIER